MFPETFGNNSVKAGVLLGEIHQQIKPTLVSFGILRGVDPVIQRQPRGIHVLLAAMLLLQHVVQSARQPKPQTPDVPAWFICVRSYVCVHIWASIYGRPYMDIHIWTSIYGRVSFVVSMTLTCRQVQTCRQVRTWKASRATCRYSSSCRRC